LERKINLVNCTIISIHTIIIIPVKEKEKDFVFSGIDSEVEILKRQTRQK